MKTATTRTRSRGPSDQEFLPSGRLKFDFEKAVKAPAPRPPSRFVTDYVEIRIGQDGQVYMVGR